MSTESGNRPPGSPWHTPADPTAHEALEAAVEPRMRHVLTGHDHPCDCPKCALLERVVDAMSSDELRIWTGIVRDLVTARQRLKEIRERFGLKEDSDG